MKWECEKCIHKAVCDEWRVQESMAACSYGDYFQEDILGDNYDLDYLNAMIDIIRSARVGEPLTIEQMRHMDGLPVFVEWKDGHIQPRWYIVGDTAWNMMEFDTFKDYGEWLAYAYPPAHINLTFSFLSSARCMQGKSESLMGGLTMDAISDAAALQEEYQRLADASKLIKKAMCTICVPFCDKYGLTDLQTLRIARKEMDLREMVDLLQPEGG